MKTKESYSEEPLFKLNKDIEKVFFNNYKKTLGVIFSDISKKIINFVK